MVVNGPADAVDLTEVLQPYEATIALLEEQIAALEGGLFGEPGYSVLGGGEGSFEFSAAARRKIRAVSRLLFLKNSLINRAVTLQSSYVFGQGVNVAGRHPDVDAVVQGFLDDEKNQAELTSHQARILKEQALQVDGELFFVLFTNTGTGRVRVRTLPVDEISDILCNPDDAKDPWMYQRDWVQRASPFATDRRNTEQHAYYPDWRYRPADKPARIGEHPINWDQPVYHVKVGGLPDMRFGVPETYAAHDWARAYTAFLEDVATLMRAYSRFAHKITNLPNAKAVAAGKAKLGTTASGTSGETNPPPLTGSTFLAASGVNIEAMQLRGASVDPDDGRRLLLMVCAATGMPEHYFGDASTSNLATAKSMDRPTELKFLDRQTLWVDIHAAILTFQIKAAIRAGTLKGTITVTKDGDELVDLGNETDPLSGAELLDPASGQPIPINAGIDVDFPSILEHDVGAQVEAIVNAATLGGHVLAGTLNAKLTTRLLLTALGEDDLDDLLDELFPEDESEDEAGQDVEDDVVPGVPPTPATESARRRGRSRRKTKTLVTPSALAAAAAFWNGAAPTELRGLIAAGAQG